MKYLALGDSYTIGELVPFEKNFPHQLVSFLKQKNIFIDELKIIAKTGWTTNELIAAMENQIYHHEYDLVTLLIGVNNQYRGRNVEEYEIHFAYLLNRAITFAQGNTSKVIVLSIPDWGLTPFNKDRDAHLVSTEIDAYNKVANAVCKDNQICFIDITESTRANAKDESFLASDLLHPSGKEYAIWANLLNLHLIK